MNKRDLYEQKGFVILSKTGVPGDRSSSLGVKAKDPLLYFQAGPAH